MGGLGDPRAARGRMTRGKHLRLSGRVLTVGAAQAGAVESVKFWIYSEWNVNRIS